ncbi:alpha/beta hydrolase [Streptomyces syringium]|uniref:alpha/beta hydrolase n=1 Tax=Streptomyces syringium TaxID=76729 RepID=UPI0037D31478
MVTIKELTELDRSKFSDAAGGWAAVSSRGSAAMDRVNNEMIAKLQATQQGQADKAARKSLAQLSSNFQYIHAECGLIRTALSGLASELEGPQRKLKEALADAAALKFTVDANGAVKYPATVPYAPNLSGAQPKDAPFVTSGDPNEGKARAIATRIAAALSEANEIDGRYARALAMLKTDGNLKEPNWADVARDTKEIQGAAGKYLKESDIPKGKTPKENAAWWGRLSQAQREEYISVHPASIGALDGLPATVRDDANRLVLAETRGNVEQQIKHLEDIEPKKYQQKINPFTGLPIQGEEEKRYAWLEWEKKKKALEVQMKGIGAIEERFGRTGYVEREGERPVPEAYLLGFDIKGIGHAAIANGNPDTAVHTAVYVPGTTTNLSTIGGDMSRMEKLWSVSTDLADGDSVSTVTWLGYEAPQSLAIDSPQHGYANDGGPKLNEFLGGLRTSHEGPTGHLTVEGHSYGSTVIGSAARQGHLPVDDIFVAGSPGMQVRHASQLDVTPDHVWAAQADGNPYFKGLPTPGSPFSGGKDGGIHIPFLTSDPVPEIGGWSHAPKEIDIDILPEWIDGDGVGPPVKTLTPTNPHFGANIVETGDARGHSAYWDKDSEILRNQARVVVGKYDKVTLEDD